MESNSNSSERLKSSNTNKPHKCSFEGCTASFPRPHKLEAHIRKHNGERPFICNYPDCSKTYTNSSHLKRHKVTAHENLEEDREYICSSKGCRLVFANKYILQKHLKRFHHEDNFPFKCNNCDERFKKRKHLAEHFNFVHDNVPYKCESCQLGFLSLIQYTKHKSNHRMFTCDCEKVFDRWTNFCKHRRTDCPLKRIEHPCVICNKTFKTKSNLKAHCLKVHVEESQGETYKCPYMDCKRSYQYKRNLNYHIAFHHEKSKHVQLKCTHSECELVFKTEVYLHRHLKRMHGERIKKQKPKKPRKDRGKKKLCMAAILSGVKLAPEEHLGIIDSNRPDKDSISLTSLKISVSKNRHRNHIGKELKLGTMTGSIKIPKTENRLQGQMLIVILTQDSINALWNKQNRSDKCEDGGYISDSVLLQKCDEILKVLPNLDNDTENNKRMEHEAVLSQEKDEFCNKNCTKRDSAQLQKCDKILNCLDDINDQSGIVERTENMELDENVIKDSVRLQKCDESLKVLPHLDGQVLDKSNLDDISEQSEIGEEIETAQDESVVDMELDENGTQDSVQLQKCDQILQVPSNQISLNQSRIVGEGEESGNDSDFDIDREKFCNDDVSDSVQPQKHNEILNVPVESEIENQEQPHIVARTTTCLDDNNDQSRIVGEAEVARNQSVVDKNAIKDFVQLQKWDDILKVPADLKDETKYHEQSHIVKKTVSSGNDSIYDLVRNEIFKNNENAVIKDFDQPQERDEILKELPNMENEIQTRNSLVDEQSGIEETEASGNESDFNIESDEFCNEDGIQLQKRDNIKIPAEKSKQSHIVEETETSGNISIFDLVKNEIFKNKNDSIKHSDQSQKSDNSFKLSPNLNREILNSLDDINEQSGLVEEAEASGNESDFDMERDDFYDTNAVRDSVQLQKCDKVLKTTAGLDNENESNEESIASSNNSMFDFVRNELFKTTDAVKDSDQAQKCDESLNLNSDIEKQSPTAKEKVTSGYASIEQKREENSIQCHSLLLHKCDNILKVLLDLDSKIRKDIFKDLNKQPENIEETVADFDEDKDNNCAKYHSVLVQKCDKILKVLEDLNNEMHRNNFVKTLNDKSDTVGTNIDDDPQIMLEIDPETKKILVDSSNNSLSNLEFVSVSNEGATFRGDGQIVQQYVKILEVVPANISCISSQIQCDVIT